MTKSKLPVPPKQAPAHTAGRAQNAQVHTQIIVDASQVVDKKLQVRYRMALEMLHSQAGESYGDLQLAACLVATQSVLEQIVPATYGFPTAVVPRPVSGSSSSGAAINESQKEIAVNLNEKFRLLSKQLAGIADTGRQMHKATQMLQASTEKMTRNVNGVNQSLDKFKLP